jgi:hypothetical protein
MNVFCTLPSLANMALFCLAAGAVIGVSLATRPAAAPASASGCSTAMASPHPMAPGARIPRGGARMETHHMIASLLAGLMTLWLA